MNKIILTILIFVSYSCNSTDFQIEENIVPNKTVVNEKWLTNLIENHLNKSDTYMENITTPKYAEYKQDAINIPYDGGMTIEEFEEKWSAIYDTKLTGIGESFLIGQQDWGEITVTKCKLVSSKNDKYLFDVEITDNMEGNISHHKREIKIVMLNNEALIDDVKVYK